MSKKPKGRREVRLAQFKLAPVIEPAPSKDPVAELREAALLRTPDIIGDKTTTPPTPALVPISRSTLWLMVKKRKFPKPFIIGAGTTVWKASDVLAWLRRQGGAL